MKKICLLVIASIMAVCFTACGKDTAEEQSRENLEFTVVSEDRLSDELKEILDQKKESAFKLTYADEGYLYICIGYGKQESGGYSVTVNDLYETKAGSTPATSPSYPYIVLKVEFREKTVVFD